uniref:Uncharacterized protein n=1 Tax=Acrobeloides nanus TaxID=290746 RepID=A0A914DMQ4_9BILA
RRFEAFGDIGRMPQSELSAPAPMTSKSNPTSKEGLADLQKQLLEMNLKEHENKKEMHDIQMKFFEEGRLFFKESRERYAKKEYRTS